MDSVTQKAAILVVDDNPEIREILHILLEGEGFDIVEAETGDTALKETKTQDFDLIILDIMMPGMNGYKTCKEIRRYSNAPILFLSAKSQEGDKMLGFSSGGDDFLAKPFSYNELVSRAKALIRRYQAYGGKGNGIRTENEEIPAESVIRFYNLEINETRRSVSRDGNPIELTDTEYALLHLMVKNKGQTFSAERLYESVWQEPYYYGAGHTVMVHIRNLRGKIEKNPKNPVLIKNVWGKGYYCG